MNGVNGKFWRNAASLIMLSKRNSDSFSCRSGISNYDVLLQTRPGTVSFPKSVVFPGGVTEPADESAEWFHLLQSFGYTDNDLNAFHRANTLTTPIFQPDPVKRHVSLRISAIRETFEEIGILIGSSRHKCIRSDRGATIICDFDVKSWQEKVSSNPEELLNLCKELKCYPDIFSLYYWSNWLTPKEYPKRFDTAFFLALVENHSSFITKTSEVTAVQWSSPEEVLFKNSKKAIQLLPPQIYELNRLLHFKDINHLIKYASERSRDGTDLMFPIKIKAKDGILRVFPGDDLYSLNEDPNQLSEQTILDLRNLSVKLNRLEEYFEDLGSKLIIRNITTLNHINMGDKSIIVRSSCIED
ncbi:hypothetical protein ACJJTC_012773 [Scirpophaga incertulas]